MYQFLFLVCCFCVTWELWRRNLKKTTSTPPVFPGSLPVIGHAWKMIGDRKHAFNLIKLVSKEFLEIGGAVTVHIGPRTMYVLTDPEECNLVSNACLEKDYYYAFAKPFLGNGLTILTDVPLWKQHRKFLSPTFRQQILNDFLVVFNCQGKKLVQMFQSKLGKGPFDHEKLIRLNNLESICMTAFGADVDLGGLHKQYINGVNDILDVFTERFQKFWMHSDFIYNMTSLKKRQDAIAKSIHEFTSAIIRKRKEEMKENPLNSTKSGQFTPFMNQILELSQDNDSYTDEDILHEINTIVVAGYDTTAFTITLALMLLGSHPEVQKKVYEEMQKVFGNSDRDVDKDDIPKFIYLEAVLKETMRLYPIAPVVARYIVKDVQLTGNGVAMMFWALHRHKLWGEDVEEFRPERWLEGSLSSFNNAFAEFSIGKRACIGKTYAMMSMKTVLSHVLRSYVITSDLSCLELEIDAILKLASGLNISIEERKFE